MATTMIAQGHQVSTSFPFSLTPSNMRMKLENSLWHHMLGIQPFSLPCETGKDEILSHYLGPITS